MGTVTVQTNAGVLTLQSPTLATVDCLGSVVCADSLTVTALFNLRYIKASPIKV